MRRWIRLDAEVAVRTADMTDAEFRAYIAAIVAAKWQPTPGIFATERLLAAVLEMAGRRLPRQIPRLIASGRLIRHENGAISVREWTKWQRPATSAERSFAYRERKRVTSRDEIVTPRGERESTRDANRDGQPRPLHPDDIPRGQRLVETDAGWKPATDPDADEGR